MIIAVNKRQVYIMSYTIYLDGNEKAGQMTLPLILLKSIFYSVGKIDQ